MRVISQRPDVTTSDLALAAAQRAIEAADIDPQTIDLIVVATSTPDFVFPSTACLLQNKLQIKNGGAAFDIQAVCSGFAYAVATVDALIRSGQHRTALIVGAETFSRILDFNDRTTCVLFGDGAGAVILQASDEPGVLASALHADGSYADILCTPGHVNGGVVAGSAFLHMDGQAVFKLAVNVLEKVAVEALQKADLSPEQVDWLIPHQANIRIMTQHVPQAARAAGAHGRDRRRTRQYVGRVDPASARCRCARRSHQARPARADRRRRRRLHLGCVRHPLLIGSLSAARPDERRPVSMRAQRRCSFTFGLVTI